MTAVQKDHSEADTHCFHLYDERDQKEHLFPMPPVEYEETPLKYAFASRIVRESGVQTMERLIDAASDSRHDRGSEKDTIGQCIYHIISCGI